MGLFDALTGQAAKDAAEKNSQLYDQYRADAFKALDAGLGNSETYLNHAIDAYAPLAALGQQYSAAPSLLLDSLGVNGAAGNDRAVGAFRASPGYQWEVNQATDQVARKAASLGLAASGNTLAGIQDRANNLADQEYNNWRGGLAGFINPALAATSGAAAGRAQGYTNFSNLFQNDATNRVNVFGNYASGNANSNTQAANAEMQGSSNFWNGLMSLGGNVAKGYFGGAK